VRSVPSLSDLPLGSTPENNSRYRWMGRCTITGTYWGKENTNAEHQIAAARNVGSLKMKQMTLICKSSKLTWGHLTVWFGACLIILHANNVLAQEPDRIYTLAQDPDRIYTVAGRFAPVLQPVGVPVGAMRLFPRVGVGALYSDNVFANDEFEKSDWALLTQAEAVLRSDTSRYFAEMGVRADLARSNDFDENDYDNGRLWFSGELDLTGTSKVDVDLSYAGLTEPRTSNDIAPGSTELTEYSVSTISGVYNYQPSRWKLRLDGRYRNIDFDDSETLTGVVNNDDRDRKMLDFGARVGFDIERNYGLFLEGRIDDVDYDQPVDNQGFERSYDGYEIRLGTELKLSGLVMGEFFLGYLSRDFDDPRFDKADGLSYGTAIDYVITNLWTLKIGGSRTTDPTTVAGASTVLNSEISLDIDYELRRNLMLQMGFKYVNEDFESTAREDDDKIFSFGAEYRMNRNIWLTAGFRRWDRDSSPADLAGREFTINEVIIEVTYQL
jgi:hypothetical protein